MEQAPLLWQVPGEHLLLPGPKAMALNDPANPTWRGWHSCAQSVLVVRPRGVTSFCSPGTSFWVLFFAYVKQSLKDAPENGLVFINMAGRSQSISMGQLTSPSQCSAVTLATESNQVHEPTSISCPRTGVKAEPPCLEILPMHSTISPQRKILTLERHIVYFFCIVSSSLYFKEELISASAPVSHQPSIGASDSL